MAQIDPQQRLQSLNATETAFAELKALVGGVTGKGLFVDLVKATQIPSPDLKAWAPAKINQVLDALRQKHIIDENLAIVPDLSESLTLNALARPQARALCKTILNVAPQSLTGQSIYSGWNRSHPARDADLARSVRLAVLADDFKRVQMLLNAALDLTKSESNGASIVPLLLQGLPKRTTFLGTLRLPLQDLLMSSFIDAFLDLGQFDASLCHFIEDVDQQSRNWTDYPKLDRSLLRLDLLRERADSAFARLERLKNLDASFAAGAHATLTFLSDPSQDSTDLFKSALKLHRKAIGKRRATLPSEFGAFHIMALFAQATPAAYAEIKILLETDKGPDTLLSDAFESLLGFVSGQDENAKTRINSIARATPSTYSQPRPVKIALTSLIIGLIDAKALATRRKADLEVVGRWGPKAALATRIVCQVHQQNGANNAQWTLPLEGLGKGYERDFRSIIAIKPSWERALDKLETFLVPENISKAVPETQDRRLVFRFDAISHEITPWEQVLKRGQWTGGQLVGLKRLHARDSKLTYLTSDDHRVIQTIKLHRDYYENNYTFDPYRGPAALIGHPRVYDANEPDQPVDLIDYPPELVVRHVNDDIHIELSHRAVTQAIFIELETPDRWRVIKITQACIDLASILGPKGLTAPKTAEARILALIKAQNPRLPIRSELDGALDEVRQGATRPLIQITPSEGSFLLQALVRPSGADGPSFLPGKGQAQTLYKHDGALHRVARDLHAETQALEALIDACPELEPWRISDHRWDIEGHEALLETLQQLHDFSEGVDIEWPKGASISTSRTVDFSNLSMSLTSAKTWFEVKGTLRVDEDLVLDMSDLLTKLGMAKGRFIHLDEGRYLALTDALRRNLDAFAALTESAKAGRKLQNLAALAGPVTDLMALAGKVKADDTWKRMIENRDAAEGYNPSVPDGFVAQLRDYQLDGFTWLARLCRLELGACLADDMGLGKTLQTLALMVLEAPKGPSIVVAPTSVCSNWIDEAQKFAPGLRCSLLSAAIDRKALIDAVGPNDVLVVSYGLLFQEREALASKRFHIAVFDEAQNLKNSETRRAQAGKSLDADFRLALSGTPIENRLDELWSLFDTVTPGLLGSKENFQKRFSGPIEKDKSQEASATLKTLIRPYLLRRTKAMVLSELPARTEITLGVEPSLEEEAFYEALRRQALDILTQSDGPKGPGQKRMRILAEITRLRRAACHPALINPQLGLQSAKLDQLLELCSELKANMHRALIFSQFTGYLDLVQDALTDAGFSILRLDGSTPAKQRGQLVDRFQSGEADLFLISLKAGGTGLNLTAADFVIHLDPWWNPAVEDQATDRAHRFGQTRPVTVYRLVLNKSIEEQILALHGQKRALSADLLEGTDSSAQLAEDELISLISGRK